MSSQQMEPDVPADATAEEQDLGGLTVEDDPAGTIHPEELAGTADESDEDVH